MEVCVEPYKLRRHRFEEGIRHAPPGSEGSIAVAGFERGLSEWREFLKSKRFLVVHDEKGNVMEKLGQISVCGYDVLGYFMPDQETWKKEYYFPLQRLINETRPKHAGDRQALAMLDNEQQEVEMFKKEPVRCSSLFFIMMKR